MFSWVGGFLDSWPWMERWKDPRAVWAFQEWFGVRKVEVVVAEKENGEEVYEAVCHEEWVKRKTTKARQSNGHGKEGANNNNRGRRRNVVVYQIGSWFWHHVFLLGTQLGDEAFYAFFFSFWFWNLDAAVGRKVVLSWNLILYIGQGLKDIIRWPRPAMPTAVALEHKWAREYGMPSTHAMVAVSIPISVLYFTIDRYHQYSLLLWGVVALTWCLLVCTSRIYLGMHTLADVYVGIIFASLLQVFLLPLIEATDLPLITQPLSPLVVVLLSISGMWFYPGSDRWTPARGEVAGILGYFCGVHLAIWSNYQLGFLHGPSQPPPYDISWPVSAHQCLLMFLRVLVGAVILVVTRTVGKRLSYTMICRIMNQDGEVLRRQKEDIGNKCKVLAELTTLFSTYVAFGFNTMFLVPMAFQVLGIERAALYKEL